MTGVHEEHADDCACVLCAEWMKDFIREQDEDAMKELAAEEKRERERGPDAWEDYERYPY